MEALGLDAGFEAGGCNCHLERTLHRQLPLEVLDQHLVLADNQHLGHCLVFQVSQGHTMLLEEPNQILTRDASVLRSGDAVSAEPT
jgi:hypothetical protein